jgi:hypothetical protein
LLFVADYAALTNQFLIGALMVCQMQILHFVKNILIPEQEKSITLRGTGQAPVQKYWKELLKKIESGEFDPTIILSHRFRIDEFRELYDAFDKEYGIIKAFVQPRFSSPPAPGTPALSSFKSGDIKPSADVPKA